VYYDLKLPYRIAAAAKVAIDEDGEGTEAYVRISFDNCKNDITNEQYSQIHEEQREDVAEMLKVDVEYVFCISGEEYEANTDEEEED